MKNRQKFHVSLEGRRVNQSMSHLVYYHRPQKNNKSQKSWISTCGSYFFSFSAIKAFRSLSIWTAAWKVINQPYCGLIRSQRVIRFIYLHIPDSTCACRFLWVKWSQTADLRDVVLFKTDFFAADEFIFYHQTLCFFFSLNTKFISCSHQTASLTFTTKGRGKVWVTTNCKTLLKQHIDLQQQFQASGHNQTHKKLKFHQVV